MQKDKEVSLVKKKVFVDVEVLFKSYTANILLVSGVEEKDGLLGDYTEGDWVNF